MSSSSLHSSPSSTPSSALGTPSASYDDVPALALEKDFCSNFSCCGLVLADMHELLDHFEGAHVPVLGIDGTPIHPPFASNTSSNPSSAPVSNLLVGYPQPHPPAETSPYSYAVHDMDHYAQTSSNKAVSPSGTSPSCGYGYQGFGTGLGFPDLQDTYDPFGFDDFALSSTSSSPSSSSSLFDHPPALCVDTTLSQADADASRAPSPTLTATSASTAPYSSAPSSASVFSQRSSASSTFSSPDLPRVHNAERPQSQCLPPALFSLPSQRQLSLPAQVQGMSQLTTALPLIESKSQALTRTASAESYSIGPSLSRRNTAGSVSTPVDKDKVVNSRGTGKVGPHRTPAANAHTGRPASALSATIGRRRRDGREKAYKCPHPGCTKSYLNPNGLKYHLEKGTCAIDVDYVPLPVSSTPYLQLHGARDSKEGHELEKTEEDIERSGMTVLTTIALPSVPPVSPISPV